MNFEMSCFCFAFTFRRYIVSALSVVICGQKPDMRNHNDIEAMGQWVVCMCVCQRGRRSEKSKETSCWNKRRKHADEEQCCRDVNNADRKPEQPYF